MKQYKKEQMKIDLQEARNRLADYLAQEKKILIGGVQSYGIGNRSLTRYNTDLSNIRAAIKDLKNEINELDALLNGDRPRRAVRIIPQDW